MFDVFDNPVIEIIAEALLAQKLGASLAAFAQTCKRMRGICGSALTLYKEDCLKIAYIAKLGDPFCEVVYPNGEGRTMINAQKKSYIHPALGAEVILDKLGKMHSYGGNWAMHDHRAYFWFDHGVLTKRKNVP